MIENHSTPTLSALDMRMVCAIPPGGNWKDIPESIPSARLAQIRTSYAAGEGSRSTYYGRLLPNAPAYTISTYFNRPGNGCFIHYGANRLISQREAARLQSFPDSFVFLGSQREVNQQIGNAVPPLLAYQIAKTLGEPGSYVDIFSGAGGLSLGLTWAGWQPVAANDISCKFLNTYSRNIHPAIVPGNLVDPSVSEALLQLIESRDFKRPLALIGGPPCQGFSTAGKRRSMDDERNHLFGAYVDLLRRLRPDTFVFENVTGLLNMESGAVLRGIISQLEQAGYTTQVWKLKSEEYGLPQRRHRIFILGRSLGQPGPVCPTRVTSMSPSPLFSEALPPPPTVARAISDLPPLNPGDELQHNSYLTAPSNSYQRFMRGEIDCREYLANIAD